MSAWNYSSHGYDSASDDECDGYPFTTGVIRRSPMMNGRTSYHREQSMTSIMNYSSNSIEHSDDDENDNDNDSEFYDDDNDDDNSSIGCQSTVSTISGKSFVSNTTFNTVTNITIPNNMGLVQSSSTTKITTSTATMRRCSSVGNNTIPAITESGNFSSSNGCNYAYNNHSNTCTTVPSIPTPIRFMASGGGTTTTPSCQPPLSSSPIGKLKKQYQHQQQQTKRRKKKIQPPSKNTSLIINVVLLLVSIVCILTPFYFALVYALPKSGISNSTTNTTSSSTPASTISSTSSTLAIIGERTITNNNNNNFNNNNITKAESKIYDSIQRMNSMKITKTTVSSTEMERKDREFLRGRERRHRFLRRNNKFLI